MSDDVKNSAPEMTLEEAQAKIQELEKQTQEYLAGWQRAKADYVNFKNDQEKRGKEISQFAGLMVLSQIIPVQEHLRKSLDIPAEQRTAEWIRGIELIYQQMRDVLKMLGVEELHAELGKPFDPAMQEAAGQEARAEMEEGIVTQEVNAGYSLHGRIVAPIKVIVSKK